MPGAILSVPGTSMGVWSGQLAAYINDEDNTDLWTANFSNGNRGMKTAEGYESNTWQGGVWPECSGFISQQGVNLAGPNQGTSVPASLQWEPFSGGRGGGHQQKYFLGKVLNAAGQGISGATVTAFIAATNVFAGQTTSQPDGTYECPSPYGTGLQHYLIAQQGTPPSSVAGCSSNTLIPTNRDGT